MSVWHGETDVATAIRHHPVPLLGLGVSVREQAAAQKSAAAAGQSPDS